MLVVIQLYIIKYCRHDHGRELTTTNHPNRATSHAYIYKANKPNPKSAVILLVFSALTTTQTKPQKDNTTENNKIDYY